jgi:uncharacterized repeat protein (TIGR04052 family)
MSAAPALPAAPLLRSTVLGAALIGCGHKHGDSGHDHDHHHDHDSGAGADGGDGAGEVAHSLRFAAVVGDAAFACGQSVEINGSALLPKDLRFFVSEPVALLEGGGEAPLALGAEAPWQDGAVALLDFEDATGGCEGSGPTNTALVVSGPAGPWAGLRFTVGVPFDLNHADAATAGAPLNTSAMFWSWASGYKFLKFDGSTAGMPGGLALHLGSTGCAADASGAVTDCAHPNRAVIELVGPIDPETSVVTLDLAALLDGMDLESNTPDTAPGCMSAPNDPECAGPFAQLGLPFGDASPAGQRAFSIR